MTQQKSAFRDEFRIVPRFVLWLAGFCWVALLIAFLGLIPQYVPDSPPFAARLFMSIVGGAFLTAYLCLVGYVNQDAKRRDMGQALWTFMVILIPYCFGFLAYFVLRKPILGGCPKCGARVEKGFHYCPKCGYGLAPTCGHCGQMVQREYVCCPYCGKALAAQTT